MIDLKKNKKSVFYILFTLIVLVVFASIYFVKHIQGERKAKAAAMQPQHYPVVSAVSAKLVNWEPTYESVATVKAIQGVNVSTQLSGKVANILFDSGAFVKKGQLLLVIDDRVDVQSLNNYLATLRINRLTVQRYKKLLSSGAVSAQSYDKYKAAYEESLANVRKAQATIAYKHIRAPFSGRLGINQVVVGTYLNPGDTIVNLQSTGKVYVDFALPEQYMNQVQVGRQVTVTVAGRSYTGKVKAIDSSVDISTRNFAVRAIFANRAGLLKPGTFAQAEVYLGQSHQVLVVPRTAVIYSLYGSSLYVPVPTKVKGLYRITPRPVVFGSVVGANIIVKKGLKLSEQVVNSGQLKVRPGAQVRLNNSIVLTPVPTKTLKAQ